jgi:hypothetical protein
MSTSREPLAERMGPSGGGPLSFRGLAIWLSGALIFGTMLARAAVDIQFYFAPLVIFPLLSGIVLGGLLACLMRVGQIGHRPTIIAGAVLAVAIASVGEHYFCYAAARKTESKQSQALDAALREFPELFAGHAPAQPENFVAYMREQADRGRPLLFGYIARGWTAWASWTIDTLLILAGVSAVLAPAMFLPFCGRCRTWYRAMRSARIPADSVMLIGSIAGVDPVEHIKTGHCRLICCQSGCGTTGCELFWEDMNGDTYFARTWLHADQRNDVMQALDRVLINEENGAETKHPQE